MASSSDNRVPAKTSPATPPASLPVLPPPQGKLLALDVGLARIGVAVCDGLQLTVRPLTVVHRRSRSEDFDLLAQLARTQQVAAVICGLPLNMDGSEGPQAQTTRKWAMRLAQALRALLGQPLPVIFWDERLTTFAAQELMSEPGAGLAASLGERQGKDVGEDAVAAAVLLRAYLDAAAAGELLHYGRIDLPPRQPSGASSAPADV
jgi:putative holliday junction resolvase